jgi:hypothetical protein
MVDDFSRVWDAHLERGTCLHGRRRHHDVGHLAAVAKHTELLAHDGDDVFAYEIAVGGFPSVLLHPAQTSDVYSASGPPSADGMTGSRDRRSGASP